MGLTMRELAARVGVSEGTISRWESGNIQNMKRDKVAALSKVLEIPTEVIMGWDSDADRFRKTAKAFNDSHPNFLTAQEKEHIKKYRLLSTASRRQVDTYTATLLEAESMMKAAHEGMLSTGDNEAKQSDLNTIKDNF